MFDPTLLRTFLAVAQTLSFTKAAGQLRLSQPTVSQHIRKLEVAAGRALVHRDTRDVTLTDNGEAMAGFARTILAAHDQADSYFSGSAMRGRIRLGCADDLALTQLPKFLREFRQLHPQINLELTVTQSGPLYRNLQSGQFDLIYVKQSPGGGEGTVVRRDHMVWMGTPQATVPADGPVPLIAYRNRSFSRALAMDALEAAGRTWKITCSTREVNGVLAAVRAGIGVAVFPRTLIPDDLAELSVQANLPELGDVEFVLLTNPLAPKEPLDALVNAILSRPQKG
ncbi:LysR substrate-binding domain-containing protein [Saxibacter everestensis]|uniref:LysR substrate-binding domain-containing protein n=1 Tax=Saxibacter everestensis TaxID=2909229 RepID=A0ABY8QRM2_9MICO|nr:LysR substrate-binding domain-containing protein [Brevibacteriaceae bacterium ZFBP1038]